MNCSHLYSGFHYVGALPSIAKQREIQRHLLEDLTAGFSEFTLLSIGCGFGEELDDLLSSHQLTSKSIHVTAIDIARVGQDIESQPFSARASIRLTWRQLGLLDLQLVDGFGEFDIVQLGFVLHDIDPGSKDRACCLLEKALRPGGRLLFSEIFTKGCSDQGREEARREVELIYDRFLDEADQSHRTGRMTAEQRNALVGDGTSPGVKATKNEATAGLRDFFESVEETSRRLRNAGFKDVQIGMNPVNDYLGVLIAQAERAK